jgi:hypothetical protein
MDTVRRIHVKMRNIYKILVGKREETSGEPKAKRIILTGFHAFMTTTI